MWRVSIHVLFAILFVAYSSVFSADLQKLLPDERNTISIFQEASKKVIYVHRIKTVLSGAHELLHIPSGAGSGIIWDQEGHIVTNFHVIKGADNLAISIGQHTFPVDVIGAEPRKDIAVLAIDSPKAKELIHSYKPFEIAHTKDLLVGQKVLAIGNPFGLDHSLSVGVISALGRKMPGIGGVTIRDMIQTDAAINPGNSGGPLLDSQGRLAGMNTIIYSKSGASAGVGFAVPADDIARVVNQIIQHGRVKLAGIGIERAEPSVARRLGVTRGVLISSVISNTPAARIGLSGTYRNRLGQLHLGDIIVAINHQPVGNYDALYNILSQMNVGEVITLSIIRGGKKLHYKVKTIDIGAITR